MGQTNFRRTIEDPRAFTRILSMEKHIFADLRFDSFIFYSFILISHFILISYFILYFLIHASSFLLRHFCFVMSRAKASSKLCSRLPQCSSVPSVVKGHFLMCFVVPV